MTPKHSLQSGSTPNSRKSSVWCWTTPVSSQVCSLFHRCAPASRLLAGCTRAEEIATSMWANGFDTVRALRLMAVEDMVACCGLKLGDARCLREFLEKKGLADARFVTNPRFSTPNVRRRVSFAYIIMQCNHGSDLNAGT